jgi:hypothetical protein
MVVADSLEHCWLAVTAAPDAAGIVTVSHSDDWLLMEWMNGGLDPVLGVERTVLGDALHASYIQNDELRAELATALARGSEPRTLPRQDARSGRAERADELRHNRRPGLATFRADTSIAVAAEQEQPAARDFRSA